MLRPAIAAVAIAVVIGGLQARASSSSESIRTEVPVQGGSPISIVGIWKTDADCYDFPYIAGLAHPYIGFSKDGKLGIFGQKPEPGSEPDEIYNYKIVDDDDLKIWPTDGGDRRPEARISYIVTAQPDPATEVNSVYHFRLTNHTISSDIKYPQFRWQSCTVLSS